MLELRCLHLFNRLQFDLGHIIFVHVQKDVFDHDDAKFLIGPQLIQTFKEIFIIRILQNLISDGLQQFTRRLLHIIVQEFAMLVQDHVVRCAIQLFVRELRSLLLMNLDNSIANSLPVLVGLFTLHSVGLALGCGAINLKFDTTLHIITLI